MKSSWSFHFSNSINLKQTSLLGRLNNITHDMFHNEWHFFSDFCIIYLSIHGADHLSWVSLSLSPLWIVTMRLLPGNVITIELLRTEESLDSSIELKDRKEGSSANVCFHLRGKGMETGDSFCLHVRAQGLRPAVLFCQDYNHSYFWGLFIQSFFEVTLKKVFPLQLKMDLSVFLFASMSCEMVTPPQLAASYELVL